MSDNSSLRGACRRTSAALDTRLPSRFAIVQREMSTLHPISRQAHRDCQIITERALNARHRRNRFIRQAPSLCVCFAITLTDGQRERFAQSSTRAVQFARVPKVAFLPLKSVQRAHDAQQIPDRLDGQGVWGASG